MKIDLATLIITLVIAIILWVVISLTIYSFLSTGPNCPGMDPDFIGWCE